MNTVTRLGLALSAVLLTAGCAGLPASTTTTAPVGDNRPATSAPAAPTTTEPAPSPTPTNNGVAALGETYLWTDGLAVTVSKPSPYKPSEYAAGADEFKQSVVFDITIVNNTGGTWDPGMFQATVQSANQEGSRIFDSSNNLGEPSTKLLNGREATFKLAFGVADPADIVMEVTPDWDHQSAMFHN
ncbi:MAG: hypothetical protein Q4G46_02350 [Propionibacteriaceae bacterium]|nr:hypothetical protein [Propionibacteriaceae bacterium]